jgi:UDP-glucuronate decarboxylase
VDDLIEVIVRMMISEGFTGPVNLGNPDEFTIRELADLTLQLSRSSSNLSYHPAPPDDPVRRRPNITLARTLLGWEPKIALRQGLSMTLDHFRKELGLIRT